MLLFYYLGTESHVSRADLNFSLKRKKLTLNFWSSCLLPLEWWDYRHMLLPHPFYGVLGLEPKALQMLGKDSTNWATSAARIYFSCWHWLISVSLAVSLAHCAGDGDGAQRWSIWAALSMVYCARFSPYVFNLVFSDRVSLHSPGSPGTV